MQSEPGGSSSGHCFKIIIEIKTKAAHISKYK
jgi:hypothetical protein